jgi:hypothetical protein
MSIHNTISIKILTFLDNIYYNYLLKIYEKKNSSNNTIINNNIKKYTLNNIFNDNKLFIIKPEYFIYLQYYFIYTFLHNITTNNIILYSVSMHLIHICDLIYKNLSIKYDYICKNNTNLLINTSYSLFIYLFSLKILFLRLYIYYKIFFFINFILFYILMNINDIYYKRIQSINLNKEFYHPFKIIILSPNKEFMLNIFNKTKFFTYSNFLLFINILLFFII